jgi:hypothetical protein
MLESLKNELIAGRFKLSLPTCKLRQCGTKTPRTYSGSGFVSQEDDGNLTLRMFATDDLNDGEKFNRIWPTNVIPGVLMPDTTYYDFESVDQDGNHWRAMRQSINETFGVGTEIEVQLRRLEKVEVYGKPEDVAWKKWFIPGDIELPWHLTTSTERSTRADHFEYEDAAFVWNVHKVEGGLDIQLKVKHLPLEPHATRFLRALAMLTGRSMEPVVSYSTGNGELITRIHPRPRVEVSNLVSPFNLRTYAHDGAHRFLACCLHHADQKQPKHKDQLLVLYQFWYRILRAHQGDIENSSLVLSVAIEGTIKAIFHCEHDVDIEFSDLMKKALPTIKALAINERVRNSMLKSLENATFPKPKDTMLRLKQQGFLTDLHIKAWSSMRNTGAHGNLLEDSNNIFQAHLTRYFCCLDFFYRLLFVAIGYKGKYVDRSKIGWPESRFPTPNTVETLVTRPS